MSTLPGDIEAVKAIVSMSTPKHVALVVGVTSFFLLMSRPSSESKSYKLPCSVRCRMAYYIINICGDVTIVCVHDVTNGVTEALGHGRPVPEAEREVQNAKVGIIEGQT